jgi:hypothetical protein
MMWQNVNGYDKMKNSAWLLAAGAMLAGCSDAKRPIPVPAYSPTESARQAFMDYDKNGNGILEGPELELCPALHKFAKMQKKETLSLQDLEDHLAGYQKAHVGLMSVSCRVLRNGEPLAGANVVFTPEKFMGGSVKAGSGESDANGRVILRVDGDNLPPGLSPGFYRIEVSLKNDQGQESVPARYNAQTTLGEELGPTHKGAVIIDLSF